MRGFPMLRNIFNTARKAIISTRPEAKESNFVGSATRFLTSTAIASQTPPPVLNKLNINELRNSKSLSISPLNFGKYEDREVKVTNFKLEECGCTTLGGDIFDVPIRPDIVHRVVVWQLAKRRQGTHSTLRRSEVSRTGRKPYQQKGTGRARHGDLKAPQFRGGGVAFGPKPRSHEIGLQKKVRRLGLKSALSARMAEGKIMVMDSLKPEDHKTKNIVQFVEAIGSKKVLLVDGHWAPNQALKRAAGNLHYANTIPAGGLNVYSILQHDTLVISLAALKKLEERLRAPVNR